MEPVTTTIVAALVAGAAAASTDVAAQAVKDAYAGLKALVIRKLGKKARLANALETMEEELNSKNRQGLLAEELDKAQAGEDAEVVGKAQELLALLEEQRIKPGTSYYAVVRGSGAAAQDHSTAAGEGGVAISGDVEGGVHIGGRGKDK